MCIQKPNPNMYPEKERKRRERENGKNWKWWNCMVMYWVESTGYCIQKPKPKVYPESQKARIKVETPGTLWQEQKVLGKPKPEMNREIYNAFFTRILQ